MIVRADERGPTLIRQTEHARICGELARAWGNDRFEPVRPLESVALAAAEHDNGWKEWEDAPRLNPETGRLHTYQDIPIEQHVLIYRRGIARAIEMDRYAGLLVSLHGSLLYSRFRAGEPGSAEFLEEQSKVQAELIGELKRIAEFKRFSTDPGLSINRDLMFAWDALSLFLCHGTAWLDHLDVPSDYKGRRTRVAVRGRDAEWYLDPYPFRESPLRLAIAAVQIDAARFEGEDALRLALKRSTEVRLEATIAAA